MHYNKETFSKPYKISFDYRPEYLYVYVSGERDNYEISKQYWQEIADECSRNKVRRVLIVEDIDESTSIADVYQVGAEISQMGFFGIRIAFVDSHIGHHDLNQFGEMVALNRGLYGKVFNDPAEAEKWLVSE